MTTKTIEERIAHLQSVTLPESSRTRMREELSAYADLHVFVEAPASIPSPYFSHTFSFISGSFFRVSAALVVLVSMLGGTAYAANDARPGQPLYPVKLNFTEPVQTALIPSTEGKAAWHAILAERRLEEATDLAVAGKLDTATQGTITDNFTKHVQDSSEAATQLQQEGNVTAALNVRSDLEARITAHEDILTQVVTHLAVVASSTDDVAAGTSVTATKNLLAVVHDSQNTVAGERLALEDSLGMGEATTTVSAVAVADAPVTTDLAIATKAKAPVPSTYSLMRASAKRSAFADSSTTARTTEIAAILFKNSALLKSLETGTTTASTTQNTASTTPDGTASTTESTESEVILKK